MEPNFFDSIPIEPPLQRIYSRLGYAQGRTKITSRQRAQTDKYIDQACGMIRLKAASLRLAVAGIVSGEVRLPEKVIFQSRALAQYLAGAKELLLMGATSGRKILQAIAKDSQGRDVAKAAVFDAVASEMTDAVFDWLTELISRQLSRENKALLSRRFSCGYGDFSLENQKRIYALLQMQRIGVSITPECILVPEKSVTAVCGIVEY